MNRGAQSVGQEGAVLAGGEPLIELRGVSRSYRMGAYEVPALRGIDLTIRRGEFVAIVGPSGSGKSTLMYVLGCLDTPSAGSYWLGGREVSRLGDVELSAVRNREIGFVFQQFFLLPELKVTDNVGLGLTYGGVPRAERRRVAGAIAGRLGLGERLGHRPTELSGGQTQRVAIARALATGPSLVLADEPTGNLDTQTGGEILEQFRALNRQGKTVVLVTHDRSIAAQVPRVVTLVDGRIVSDERSDVAVGAGAECREEFGPVRGSGRMGWRDMLWMALREGLLVHKLRSLLTMLGIIFGIAAVIIMTAITEGGKQRQLEQLRQVGMRNVFVRDAGLQGAALLRERRMNPEGVSTTDLEMLRRYVPEAETVAGWKALKIELRRGDRIVENVKALGVLGDFQGVANYYVGRTGGRFIQDDDQGSFARVCVLGPELADELGIGPIGGTAQWVIAGDQPFEVVGVMERKAFARSEIADVSIANRNRELYMPYSTMRSFFARDAKASQLDEIGICMRSEVGLVAVSERIKHMVKRLHQDAADFEVLVPLEKLKQARKTEEVFNVIIIVIAGISLVVGGIGIMNIMLATVTERTREIGVRRALGASKRNVMGQFLTESLLIAVFGGLLGIVAGVGGGALVQWIFGFVVSFSLGIIWMAALVSMGVGVVFGIYPAWKAALMDPVEALRN